MTTAQKQNNTILQKKTYLKKHATIAQLNNETLSVEKYLKSIGYYSASIQKTLVAKDTTYVTFNLGNKIETALLNVHPTDLQLLKNFNIKNGILKVPVVNLETTLIAITKTLDLEGLSFSETSLKNTKINGAILTADLTIVKSKKRNINTIIIKGYKKFPTSFVNHFLKITPQTVFTKTQLKKTSKRLQSIPFVTQTKPIETLFKEDSTIVYLYLKKKKNSSFDGLVNFNTNEAGKVQLNGYLDIKLNAVFNRGETLSLLWNRFDNDRQELNLKTQIPFLYNSPVSSRFEFSLYQQDSTFLNTEFKTDFSFFLNEKLQLAINYNFTASKITNEALNSENLSTFNSQFVGISLQYNTPLNDVFLSKKATLNFNPKIGQRKSSTKTINQFKIDVSSSYVFEINKRNSIYIANKTGYLNSANILQNERYRIGGAKSIRGFNEQSLFASEYSFFNVEYHFLTSKKSFIYTVTDFGKFKDQNSLKKILGLGIGYQFLTNNSQINMSYVLGKIDKQSFDYKTSKLNISLITFF